MLGKLVAGAILGLSVIGTSVGLFDAGALAGLAELGSPVVRVVGCFMDGAILRSSVTGAIVGLCVDGTRGLFNSGESVGLSLIVAEPGSPVRALGCSVDGVVLGTSVTGAIIGLFVDRLSSGFFHNGEFVGLSRIGTEL